MRGRVNTSGNNIESMRPHEINIRTINKQTVNIQNHDNYKDNISFNCLHESIYLIPKRDSSLNIIIYGLEEDKLVLKKEIKNPFVHLPYAEFYKTIDTRYIVAIYENRAIIFDLEGEVVVGNINDPRNAIGRLEYKIIVAFTSDFYFLLVKPSKEKGFLLRKYSFAGNELIKEIELKQEGVITDVTGIKINNRIKMLSKEKWLELDYDLKIISTMSITDIKYDSFKFVSNLEPLSRAWHQLKDNILSFNFMDTMFKYDLLENKFLFYKKTNGQWYKDCRVESYNQVYNNDNEKVSGSAGLGIPSTRYNSLYNLSNHISVEEKNGRFNVTTDELYLR